MNTFIVVIKYICYIQVQTNIDLNPDVVIIITTIILLLLCQNNIENFS